MNRALLTSSSSLWETPPELFAQYDRVFQFELDPCATAATAKCSRFYSPEDDGLVKPWNPWRTYLNPPYGREIGKWTAKAAHEADLGALVVGLLPARTDTRWWNEHIVHAPTTTHINFLRGRVRFLLDGKRQDAAPFPSAVVTWYPW